MPKKKTKEEFIEDAIKVHGNKFDYSKVKYINSKTKVCIICPEHGEFWQLPYNHLQGKGCPKCANIATGNKLRIYDKNMCMKIAQQCKRKIDLIRLNYQVYRIMLKNDWLKECIHFKDERLKIFGKCESIYCYKFLNIDDLNYVYVGLTINPKERDKEHRNGKKRSSVLNFSKIHNIEIPQMEILETKLTKEEAQIKEKDYCDKFTQDGYILINIAKTGINTSSLGSINGKWTYKKCYEEAQKYVYKFDFQKYCASAYNKSLKMGWLKDFNWLKNKTIRWTDEKVEEVAAPAEEQTAVAPGFLDSEVGVTATLNADGTIATLTFDLSKQVPPACDLCDTEAFKAQFIGKKGPFVKGEGVDVVTGATFTSEGIIEALNKLFQ